MAGKAYTMREMKAIVEYLTERKAFTEIKGRKMWMEFANSGKTTRTWQSLKETFIKRILPDLHNPYYKLTLDQVRSFREGKDVAEKEKYNRLEYVTASEDSLAEVRNNKKSTPNDAASSKEGITLDEEVERVTGEDTAAKINSRNRSSADTVVLETYYDNAEQLQQILESPREQENQIKPLKDLLIFEPMTPLVKELLEDFGTESENDNEEMESTSKVEETNKKTKEAEMLEHAESDNPAEDECTEEKVEINCNPDDLNAISQTDDNILQNKPRNEKPQSEENNNGNEVEKQNHGNGTVITIHDSDEFVTADANSKTEDTVIPPNKTKRNSDQTLTSGILTSDTILPNNQECLNITKKTQNVTKTGEEKENGKRASSEHRDGKKQKITDEQSVIEIEDSPYIYGDIPVIEINSEIPDIGATVEVNTDSKHASDNSIEGASKNNTTNIDEPSTSNDNNITNVDSHKNPCLNSVSLFEEQFKTTQYSSDSEDKAPPPKENQIVEQPQKKDVVNPQKKVVENSQNNVGDNLQKNVGDNLQKNIVENPQKKVVENLQMTVVENPQKKIEEFPQVINSSQEKNKEEPSPKLAPELPKLANAGEKTTAAEGKESMVQRHKALANLFGFTNGGPSTSRKSRPAHKRFQHHHYRKHSESNSSEWMSDSDSDEYVSPPRPSKGRKRKYLKPKSSRILEDPEEGLQYVLFGKKIYPLVKNGRHVTNFVTYKHDSESDLEDESFWKKKYIQEKKKLEELKMLLNDKVTAPSNERTSPILQSSAKKFSSSVRKAEDEKLKITNEKEKATPQAEKKPETKDDKLVLKLATEHGEALQLEGGWIQISSVIPQIMQMLRNNPTSNPSNERPTLKIEAPRNSNVSDIELSSGKSTPTIITTLVDPEIHEKVNQLETKIFKEIEEREREEQTTQNEVLLTVNVAKRRGRPRKTPSPSSIPDTPAKKQRTKDDTDSKQEQTEAKETKNMKKKSSATATTSKSTTKSKQSDATSKQEEDTPEPSTSKQNTLTSKQKTATPKLSPDTAKKSTETEKKSTETAKESTVTAKPEEKETKDSKTELAVEHLKPRTSLRLSRQRDSISRDKDASVERLPSARQVRTPRKYDTDSSASDVGIRTRRSATKEKVVNMPDIDFEDDNVRFMIPPSPPKNKNPSKKKKSSDRNLVVNTNSLDSTQGYQDSDISPLKLNIKHKRRVTLTTHKKQNRRSKRRKSYPTLIQDLITSDSNKSSYFVPVRKSHSTINSEIYKSDSYQLLVPKPRAVHKMESIDENNPRHFSSVSKECSEKSSELDIIVEIGSSSNVSLPLSPELSIVENLSVSRDIINNNPGNELPTHERSDRIDHNYYIVPEVDISIPLMNQQCNPKTSNNTVNKSTLTDTFMKKISTVNLEENLTLSETLDQRLRDLLLESSKKPKQNEMENAMEVDPPSEPVKKVKTRKRCSTPRKKTNVRKAKVPKDAIIEEEHMETCSFGGRKSCPPVIKLICDENANDCTNVKQNKNTKKKKDIIKVKIQRPKDKTLGEHKMLGISMEMSVYTDSGINDSEMLKVSEDSVDLIHNHSETCLLAHECINDSVEIVEDSKSSAISVNSSISLDSDLRRLLEENSHISEELFGTAEENPNIAPKLETPATVYHSPAGTNNSILTEDLSNEVSPNKPSWYLLTEDENTQTNAHTIGFGSNLKQLFPIACAVPDLSTISETSKENEDSRKPQFGDDGTRTDTYNWPDLF